MSAKKLRQLSAVMFADIVGYTALMEADEARAVALRARHREAFQQQHVLHNGRIIQYYGDGVLSVFKSAIEAVRCAVAVQRQLQFGEPVPLRIGLHMGDIVFDDTEVYGDGVNVASRIESLGVAGAILLSAKLNDELKNHPDITTTPLGQFELKNLAEPLTIYAVSNEGIRLPQAADLAGKQGAKGKSIAVLPFVNMSSSKENEYFSDGITEEIISALSRIKSLRVTSRTSSFYFKDKHIPIRQIGKELNVTIILEGSVRLSGEMLRITAQLIEAESDAHFWSQTWDRMLENIFDIQDEVSLQIAERLKEQFGHLEIGEHLVRKQTQSIEAYEWFLKARFQFRKWNPADAQAAIGMYEQALKIDPNHAESILGLADCYKFLAATGFMPFDEAWTKAAALIYRGLELNDQLADGHYQLANLHFFTACDYGAALRASLRAISLNPNYVEAQQYLVFLYIIAGERDLAKQHLYIAQAIDPLSQETLFFSAYFDYMAGQFSVALEKSDRCLTQNPRNVPAHTLKCYCLLQLGRYSEVLGYFDRIPPEIVVPGDKLGITALTYTMMKDEPHANACLDELLVHANTAEGFRQSSFLIFLYAVSGETEKAFDWIRQAVERKAPFLLIHFVDPFVESLKSDPRYERYYRKIFRRET